jgi:glycosyltransferase involved in cell wall biosynthesis
VAPFGNNSDKYSNADYNQFDKKKIVYFGGIMRSKGAELFIPIVQALIKKGETDILFECIGGGDVEYLRNQVEENGLEKYIKIYGRMEDHSEVERLLLGCGIAIAPYYPEDKNNFSYYADPGKVKVYLGCGLPIVITDVPPIAKDIVQRNAGLIARYDADDFAEKIIHILSGYTDYRRAATEFGKEYSWKRIFSKVFIF